MTTHSAMPLPSEVDLKLRLAIIRLLDDKYRSSWGNQSKFLSAAILNSVVLEPPSNEDARVFCETHRNFIEEEAGKLHLDVELSTAVALIYCLTLVRLGPKDPDRTFNLATRAAELNIVIPSTADVCAPGGRSVENDAIDFLVTVDQYASRLLS